jgi:hypothetical protein
MISASLENSGSLFHLKMSWTNPTGPASQHEFVSEDPEQLKRRAIVEHRQHLVVNFGRLLDLIGPTVAQQPPKAAKIYDALCKVYFQMDNGHQPHFAYCEKVLELGRFIPPIVPTGIYSDAMRIWYHLTETAEKELADRQSKKWIYDWQAQ